MSNYFFKTPKSKPFVNKMTKEQKREQIIKNIIEVINQSAGDQITVNTTEIGSSYQYKDEFCITISRENKITLAMDSLMSPLKVFKLMQNLLKTNITLDNHMIVHNLPNGDILEKDKACIGRSLLLEDLRDLEEDLSDLEEMSQKELENLLS